MVELDYQRSAAKTLVNKMGLDTFVLFNIFNYCRFASYSEFAFHCFNVHVYQTGPVQDSALNCFASLRQITPCV